ncbi:MAG: AfsR/SARP family transcriptional regulator [Micromonosporaceae bacterium]
MLTEEVGRMRQQTHHQDSHVLRSSTTKLGLLGGFSLFVSDIPVVLPIHAQRVLAYLAVVPAGRNAHTRSSLAERLWSWSSIDRSHASLRTALWRIRQADRTMVHAGRNAVSLAESVEVDVHRGVAQANRLLSDDTELTPTDTHLSTLTGELLPGWDEDWLLLERERIGQIQVHALEALAHRLCRLGRYLQAIEVAYAAIAAEPLRESARAALIHVHLEEGNVVEARRQLNSYATLLRAELGIAPSPSLVARVWAGVRRSTERTPLAPPNALGQAAYGARGAQPVLRPDSRRPVSAERGRG